jgi:hypothetical protein
MSSGSKSTSRANRFKAFIRGNSAQPIPSTSAPSSPPTNYKNLKYVKDSITKSTSNVSISSTLSSSSTNKQSSQKQTKTSSIITTTTTTSDQAGLDTKKRFESLKAFTMDGCDHNRSPAINSFNSSISIREGSRLKDKFAVNSGFQTTNMPSVSVKLQPSQELSSRSSTRSDCSSPALSIASSSKMTAESPFMQAFPQKKRNTCYEISSKKDF